MIVKRGEIWLAEWIPYEMNKRVFVLDSRQISEIGNYFKDKPCAEGIPLWIMC